ncbi:MAG: hypothetical protein ACREC0_04305 [Methylocella sp.]
MIKTQGTLCLRRLAAPGASPAQPDFVRRRFDRFFQHGKLRDLTVDRTNWESGKTTINTPDGSGDLERHADIRRIPNLVNNR